MLLGDVLARFDDEATATEAILSLGDLALAASLRREAELNDQTLGAFASGAVRRYAAEASDEEWVALIGLLQGASDPGGICLKRALRHMLQRPSRANPTRNAIVEQRSEPDEYTP